MRKHYKIEIEIINQLRENNQKKSNEKNERIIKKFQKIFFHSLARIFLCCFLIILFNFVRLFIDFSHSHFILSYFPFFFSHQCHSIGVRAVVADFPSVSPLSRAPADFHSALNRRLPTLILEPVDFLLALQIPQPVPPVVHYFLKVLFLHPPDLIFPPPPLRRLLRSLLRRLSSLERRNSRIYLRITRMFFSNWRKQFEKSPIFVQNFPSK